MPQISPLFRIKEYFNYRRQAKTRFGLHSPFVYAFADKCLYDKKNYPAYKKLKAYRKSLYQNPNFLSVSNIGSGSSYFSDNKRPIKDLLRFSSASYKEMKLWYRLVNYFNAKNILELGTHLGVSTIGMAYGGKGKIITIEGDPILAEFTRKQLQKNTIENVHIINTLFENFLQQTTDKYDIIFLDGNHTYEATLRYYHQLKNLMHDNSLLIVHDIHWSPDMKNAWNKIRHDPEMHVTIDLFCCGLLFKRPEQYKEHFVIKF